MILKIEGAAIKSSFVRTGENLQYVASSVSNSTGSGETREILHSTGDPSRESSNSR